MMRAAALRCAGTLPQKKRIDLYYDVTSPYAWFAFEVLTRYRTVWNIDLKLKPAFLLGIGKAAGTIPPATKPKRAAYLHKDLFRSAAYFNVPLKPPSDVMTMMLVKGSLVPSRFLVAVAELYPDLLESASREMFMCSWSKDKDFTTDEVLAEAGLAAGLSAEALAQVQEHRTKPAIKEQLQANTAEAVQYGAFGVPTIVAHVGEEPEMFFGSDRFPVLAKEIGEAWLGPQPASPTQKL